jgi:Ca2+-binding RTX toxin-like protein
MVTVNTNDLEFILQQIKIAEADARGEQILGGVLPNTEVPWGLRRVDGSNNNLFPSQETYGAADQAFPRATTPVWANEGDDGMKFGPPIMVNGVPHNFGFANVPLGYIPLNNGLGPNGTDLPATYLNNNDYGMRIANNPALAPRSIQAGDVVDADPRIISNLVSDQTMNNPAALVTAFQVSGHPDAYTAASAIQESFIAYKDATANGLLDDASALKTAILADLDAAGITYEASPTGDLAKLTVSIGNVAPDEGLSAPFNTWMTMFGQFFSHGLDLVAKGGFGTVYIPLQADDPLYNPASPNTNFMAVTRATLDANGQPTNKVTPYVDQNQTYTSHPSHQVFLREYVLVDGKPVATGRLINGNEESGGGMATWADVKAQAKNVLGIELTDMNVFDVPLLATDPYGNFLRGENGFPQVVKLIDGLQVLVEGQIATPVNMAGAVSSGHAFLDDIAHNATPGAGKIADGDGLVSTAAQRQPSGTYDNELLDRHYIAGDGRANENIGLTAVHHVFHSEHNRQVELMKGIILETGNLTFINEWLARDVTTLDDIGTTQLAWDGERLFQAAKFVTEMQYQHLVFEEYARKVQPFVNLFVNYDGELNPAILAEFAHTVFRFGHSQLNETVDRYDANYNAQHVDLISAFLNPVEFANSGLNAEEAAGALARGMTRQQGNEIDEFVTEALRNNLVGLPLDLAAINIARGRETGVPSLNEARAQFFAGTGDSQLKPYESWYDFAMHLKNPVSLVNFIAAYGTHETITLAATAEEKREAACKIVFNVPGVSPADRLDFLLAENAYAGGSLGGLNNVDFWIGGLAEKKMVFGGMLGSTFNFVFEVQLETLQDADRFYYLSRLANLNLTAQMENNKFSDIIHRNTDATHLPGDVFSTPDYFIEADISKQFNADLGHAVDPTEGGDLILSSILPKVIRVDENGDGIAESVRYVGAEHVVMGGTADDDILIGGKGDDTFWGDAGNDRMEGGEGNDFHFGGAGNDIITDEFGDDEIRSGAGDDVVTAGQGFNLIITDTGSDFVVGGVDVDDILAGQDNDFARGSLGGSMIMGGEGNDWLEASGSNNLMLGDNGDLVQGLPIKRSVDSTIVGHDVLIGGPGNDDFDAETGDDIMISGGGTNKHFGQLGFDWASSANGTTGVHADMQNTLFAPPTIAASPATVMSEYAQTEALSGSRHSDILRGDDEVALLPEHSLLDSNVSLINGLDAFLGTVNEAGDIRFNSGNILLGGGGSDIIQGRGGNDLIDGDRFLDAKIKVTPTDGSPAYFVSGMSEIHAKMFSGEIKPSELSIWREIKDGSVAGDVDVVEYSGNLADYTIEGFNERTGIATDLNNDGWISITDTRAEFINGAVSDGVDLVKNVERVLFADGALKIAEHENRMAVGRVALEVAGGQPIADGQPVGVVGQVLRASMVGVTDRDERSATNLTGAITGDVEYTWQVETLAGSGVFVDIQRIVADNFAPMTGASYTVSAAEAGLAIRVVGRFVDSKGAVETVYSNANEGGNPPEPIPATGAPVISDNTPTENQVLTADPSNIFDANGFGPDPMQYQWQTSTDGGLTWTDVTGATTASYQPGQAQVGLLLRVEVSFVDGFGTTEILYSAATAAVVDSNVAPTGALTISDTTPQSGQTLLASSLNIRDANGFNPLTTPQSFQWQSSSDGVTWTNIAGATGASYQPGAGQIGLQLRASVTFTDGEATVETVTSAATRALGNTINGTGAADTLTGTAGDDVISGLRGNDTINAGAGDDTINWNANLPLTATDGRDVVDGGAGIDTIQIVTRALANETYRIYTRDAAIAAGITPANANTEIVITRDGTTTASSILHLDNIEEIVITGPLGGTVGVTAPTNGTPTGGTANGDTVIVIGDFRTTSLALNTITINGSAADDQVDITALESAHRIVFRTAGGNDTVVGTLRPQDVIEVPAGVDPATYVATDNGDGTVTMASDTHSVTFVGAVDALPTLAPEGSEHPEYLGPTADNQGADDTSETPEDETPDAETEGEVADDESETETADDESEAENADDESEDEAGDSISDDENCDDDADDNSTVGSGSGNSVVGAIDGVVLMPGSSAGVMVGDAGDDVIVGGASGDALLGKAGADVVLGNEGDDVAVGGSGDDVIEGGAGRDVMLGGDGDDIFIVQNSDGSDMIFGGAGSDTLDLSAVIGGAVIDLGAYTPIGTVKAGGITDHLMGVENVIGSEGADVIKAGLAVNVMTGGNGEDVFVFVSAGTANGDVITDFQVGDKIDLSGIDAMFGTNGNQAFTLADQGVTAAGSLVIREVNGVNGVDTIIDGFTDDDADADFSITLRGGHTLTDNSFNF